jgi:hypothetical protein
MTTPDPVVVPEPFHRGLEYRDLTEWPAELLQVMGPRVPGTLSPAPAAGGPREVHFHVHHHYAPTPVEDPDDWHEEVPEPYYSSPMPASSRRDTRREKIGAVVLFAVVAGVFLLVWVNAALFLAAISGALTIAAGVAAMAVISRLIPAGRRSGGCPGVTVHCPRPH